LEQKLTITAHLPVEEKYKNKTIFFRVLDPDDMSPYEVDDLGGDNNDPNFGLDKTSETTGNSPVTINGESVFAAEVTFTITDHCSGDNYIVQASFDNTFPEDEYTSETCMLVAWKRAYLEQDRMYKYGATITQVFNFDTDADDDVLYVDNTSDFNINDEIVIFTAEKKDVEGQEVEAQEVETIVTGKDDLNLT